MTLASQKRNRGDATYGGREFLVQNVQYAGFSSHPDHQEILPRIIRVVLGQRSSRKCLVGGTRMLHASLPPRSLPVRGKSGICGKERAIETHGKTRHGLPGKFPTRRACVLFTDELAARRIGPARSIRRLRTADRCRARRPTAPMQSRGTLTSSAMIRFFGNATTTAAGLIILRAREKETKTSRINFPRARQAVDRDRSTLPPIDPLD